MELLHKLHKQVQDDVNLSDGAKILMHCNISMKMAEAELNDLSNYYHNNERTNQKIVDKIGWMEYQLRERKFHIYQRPDEFKKGLEDELV